jgi:hypothetical protein
MTQKHSHYYKNVQGLKTIDVYRVLSLFNVTDPCIQHAVKKLLVAGGRGAGKNIDKDIQEAIDSLVRYQDMLNENDVMQDCQNPLTVGHGQFSGCIKAEPEIVGGAYKPADGCFK